MHGKVYNYPGRPDGDEVTTSKILEVKGNSVKCYSRDYELGDPDPKYVKECEVNGWHVPTKEMPIKT